MVHVISVLLKINKSTRENADCVCVGESEWVGDGERVFLFGEKVWFQKSTPHRFDWLTLSDLEVSEG